MEQLMKLMEQSGSPHQATNCFKDPWMEVCGVDDFKVMYPIRQGSVKRRGYVGLSQNPHALFVPMSQLTSHMAGVHSHLTPMGYQAGRFDA